MIDTMSWSCLLLGQVLHWCQEFVEFSMMDLASAERDIFFQKLMFLYRIGESIVTNKMASFFDQFISAF